MKCFTLYASGAEPGIAVHGQYVRVGSPEAGRHTDLLLGKNLRRRNLATLETAFPLRTQDNRVLVVEEDRRGDNRALVRIAVNGGDGGIGRVTSTDYEEADCPLGGDYVTRLDLAGNTEQSVCDRCGTHLTVDNLGYYYHPPGGKVQRYRPLTGPIWGWRDHTGHGAGDVSPIVFVLAEGYIDEARRNEEGRVVGSRYSEYLVVMEAKAEFRAERTGDTDRREITYNWTGEQFFVPEIEMEIKADGEFEGDYGSGVYQPE